MTNSVVVVACKKGNVKKILHVGTFDQFFLSSRLEIEIANICERKIGDALTSALRSYYQYTRMLVPKMSTEL
jgi:hypothetical protein